MPTVLYGIKNCDTVKRARDWLETAGIVFQFHDFRQNGLSATKLTHWLNVIGAEKLINKRSTTWKQLSESERKEIEKGEGKLVILANPTLIKRPVLEHQGKSYCGFQSELYATIFENH